MNDNLKSIEELCSELMLDVNNDRYFEISNSKNLHYLEFESKERMVEFLDFIESFFTKFND